MRIRCVLVKLTTHEHNKLHTFFFSRLHTILMGTEVLLCWKNSKNGVHTKKKKKKKKKQRREPTEKGKKGGNERKKKKQNHKSFLSLVHTQHTHTHTQRFIHTHNTRVVYITYYFSMTWYVAAINICYIYRIYIYTYIFAKWK